MDTNDPIIADINNLNTNKGIRDERDKLKEATRTLEARKADLALRPVVIKGLTGTGTFKAPKQDAGEDSGSYARRVGQARRDWEEKQAQDRALSSAK